jgi:hypothetical protein
MKWDFAKPISWRRGLLLLVLTGVVPVVLWLLVGARLPFLIAWLCVPVILMGCWGQPGFLLGLLFFWGSLSVWGWSTAQPGQVDNILPGVTMTLGWMPYVLFYGPVFLLIQSSDRYRAKWGVSEPAVEKGASR